MTDVETRERIRTLLDGLGDEADDVAETLLGEGCTGVPNDSERCPVTVYLRRMTSDGGLATGSLYVFGYEEGQYPGERLVVLPLPVGEFVRRFDNREYPDLAASASGDG